MKLNISKVWPPLLVVIAILVLIVDVDARGRRVLIDFGFSGDIGWIQHVPIIEVTDNRNSAVISTNGAVTDLPFVFRIGVTTYDRLWVNENGYISLGSSGADVPVEDQPGISNMADFQGDVIAPFYANIVTQEPSLDCDDDEECDIAYSVLNLDAPPDEEEDIDYLKAVRIIWGLYALLGSDAGVSQFGGDDQNLIRFQLRFIDRSIDGDASTTGDFDLEFNYDGITWEDSPTLVGVNASGVTIDISKFFDYSLLDSAGGNMEDCDDAQSDPDPGSFPYFDPSVPISCNWTTIEFRGGIPNLLDYTAAFDLTLNAPPAPFNTTENFTLGVSVTNAGPDDATNVVVEMVLPQQATLVGGVGGNAGCTQSNTIVSCPIGDIGLSQSAIKNLVLTTTSDANEIYSATAASDQLNPDMTNIGTSVQIDPDPSADISVGCSTSGSAVVGTNATVTCTVRNDGPQTSNNVVLSATLPSIVSFSSSPDCSSSGTDITCTSASIASGDFTEFSVVLNADTVGTGPVDANVSADENDPDSANNSVTVNVTVNATIPPPSGGGGGGGGGGVSILWLLFGLITVLIRKPATV